MICTPHFAHAAEWFWMLFDRNLAPFWQGETICFPKPLTQPDVSVLPALASRLDTQTCPETADIHLHVVSCNILSLKSGAKGPDHLIGVDGPARQTALLQQLHGLRCSFFGFQETRLKRLHAAHDDNYLLYKSTATSAGQGGIIAGFAKRIAYGIISTGPLRGRKLYFKDEYIGVIHSDPRSLLLRVDAPYLKFLFIVAHAPHSGQPVPIVQQWWQTLWEYIPGCYKTWPCLLAVDANISVGAEIDQHVGGFEAGPVEERAEYFQTFLQQTHTFLPATFGHLHSGASGTWTHSGGHQRRIDYIGVPLRWSLRKCKSYVDDTFDPSLLRSDHEAICVLLDFPATGSGGQRPRLARGGPLDVQTATELQHRLRGLVPLCADVHSHTALLQEQIEAALARAPRPQHQQPKKQTMSPTTWQLVQQKRALRGHLAEANQLQRQTALEQIFACWKCGASHYVELYSQLRAHQDRLIAGLLFQFRTLGRQVAGALCRDDRAFFTNLLRDGAQFLHPGHVKSLWNVLRRSIPKFRARRMGIAPHKLVALEPQWIPYLSELEVGQEVSAEDLLRHCVDGQRLRQQSMPTAVPLHALPSLQTVESALRKTQSGRATGLDRVPSETFHNFPVQMAAIYYHLVMKIFLWGQEPLQFKGGQMTMIPKKADMSLAANFRGILLLPSLAKRIHALAREQLIRQFLPFRDEGQLGGLPGQQVQYGSHAVRTAAQILASRHFSVGVLFIDLTNAFHRLVREWVTGVQDLTDFQAVITALHEAGNPDDFHGRVEELKGMLSHLACNPILRRLLEDIHSDTWFQMRQGPTVRTRRGTRPGSPLADAIFHLLMGTITGRLRDWVKQHHTFNTLLQEAEIEAPIVVWSDDLALVWATRTAPELPAALQQVM